ncbi:hypothetical protein DFJ73DRAFT_559887 [Zopfochytrium polystomum]|nr:hypothetical protein DFJ73DRAFT_559887 [Zopfochytrium polystomum]
MSTGGATKSKKAPVPPIRSPSLTPAAAGPASSTGTPTPSKTAATTDREPFAGASAVAQTLSTLSSQRRIPLRNLNSDPPGNPTATFAAAPAGKHMGSLPRHAAGKAAAAADRLSTPATSESMIQDEGDFEMGGLASSQVDLSMDLGRNSPALVDGGDGMDEDADEVIIKTPQSRKRWSDHPSRVEDDDDEDQPAATPASVRRRRGRSNLEDNPDHDDDDVEVEGTQHGETRKRRRVVKDENAQMQAAAEAKSKALADKVLAMPANTGTVESIELVNFMCHRFLQVNLIGEINFVVGQNGSGKSAILTGLTVCLGGKASFTNRASSIKSLLREGANVGAVTVKLRNQGPDAYRPGVYGDRISVERRITRDGSGSYKICSADGVCISTKKEDLTAILDHMMFLANSTPKDKYLFFMKGTLLTQLSRDFELMNKTVENMGMLLASKREVLPDLKAEYDKVKARWKEIEKSEDLENKIVHAKKMLAWSLVESAEGDEAKGVKKLDVIGEKLANAEEQLAEFKTLQSRLQEDSERKEAEKLAIRDEIEPLNAKKLNAKRDFDEAAAEVRKYSSEIRDMNKSLREATSTCKGFQIKIAEETKKLQADARAVREGKVERIDAAKAKLKDVEARLATTSTERSSIDDSLAQASNLYKEIQADEHRLMDTINREEQSIRTLSGAQANKLACYGNRYPDIVRTIDNMAAQRRWTGHKPRGPIGLYISVKNKEFTPVIEVVLGGMLGGFVVDNHDDRKALQGVLKQYDCYASVYTQDGQLFDFRSGEPGPELLTIHRAIEVTDQVVLRQLVLHASIERTVLVHTRREGDAIAERGFHGRNIVGVYTADLLKMGGGRGGLSTTALHRSNGPSRLFDNVDDVIREHRAKIEQCKADIALVKERLSQQATTLEAYRRQQGSNKNIGNYSMRKNKINAEVRQLESELEENEPANIASLEAYKKEAEEQVEGILVQITATEERLEKMKEQMDAADAIQKQLSEEVQEAKGRFARAGEVAMKAKAQAISLKQQVTDFEARRQRYKDDLAKIEADLATAREQVSQAKRAAEEISEGERIAVTRSYDVLKKDIREMEINLTQKRKQTGSKEEVLALVQATEEAYRSAKASIKSNSRLLEALRASCKVRGHTWAVFRQSISLRARNVFSMMMMKRGYKGELLINHLREVLDLRVDVHNTEAGGGDHSAKPGGGKRGGGAATDKDPRTLSGGEKSFSTVCLLLSLWDSMGNPFRALDEFDVFMDAVNRKVSMTLMIEHARRSDKKCQYIFITPQDMSHVPGLNGSDIRVVRLQDPERNQGRLNFAANRGAAAAE